MELSSSEMKTIQHQYDTLAKKVLKGEARSCYRELSKRAAHEVNFSEMNEAELARGLNMLKRTNLKENKCQYVVRKAHDRVIDLQNSYCKMEV